MNVKTVWFLITIIHNPYTGLWSVDPSPAMWGDRPLIFEWEVDCLKSAAQINKGIDAPSFCVHGVAQEDHQ